MKKVLFTATVDSHILQFHLPFLRLFKEKGYEVHVATNGNEEIPYCDIKHVVSFERSPLKLNNLKAIKQVKKIIDEEKFDIIHCHTPMGSVVTRLAAKHARKNGTRVIYTAHGFHFYKGAPLLNWMVYYPIEKWLSKYTDTIITINKEDFERAENKFGKRCKDIQYIPGVGIDKKKYDVLLSEEEKEELRKSIGIKKDDFIICFPARLDKNKNQIFLINVMDILVKQYKNFHLLLPGTDELNGYYQKIVNQRGLDANIHFLGNRTDIEKIIKITDVGVSSSIREGLGLNLIEQLYLENPVVATNNRGHRDIVLENKNGYLVDVDDCMKFAETLKRLYKEKNIYESLKSCTRKSVEKFMLENVLNEITRIYFKH